MGNCVFLTDSFFNCDLVCFLLVFLIGFKGGIHFLVGRRLCRHGENGLDLAVCLWGVLLNLFLLSPNWSIDGVVDWPPLRRVGRPPLRRVGRPVEVGEDCNGEHALSGSVGV